MIKKRQDVILETIAAKHGLTLGVAREIFSLLGDKIIETIGEQVKDDDGLYIADKAKSIRVNSLGTFVPNRAVINHINNSIKARKNEKE